MEKKYSRDGWASWRWPENPKGDRNKSGEVGRTMSESARKTVRDYMNRVGEIDLPEVVKVAYIAWKIGRETYDWGLEMTAAMVTDLVEQICQEEKTDRDPVFRGIVADAENFGVEVDRERNKGIRLEAQNAVYQLLQQEKNND